LYEADCLKEAATKNYSVFLRQHSFPGSNTLQAGSLGWLPGPGFISSGIDYLLIINLRD